MCALFNKDIVVMNVTSSAVTAMAGCKKGQSVYDVKFKVAKEYDGYADGRFFDEEDAAEAMTGALKEVAALSGASVRCVYVGVPGEFVTLVNRPGPVSSSPSSTAP